MNARNHRAGPFELEQGEHSLDRSLRAGEHERGVPLGPEWAHRGQDRSEACAVEERGFAKVDHDMPMVFGDRSRDCLGEQRRGDEVELALALQAHPVCREAPDRQARRKLRWCERFRAPLPATYHQMARL